jgi:UDP-2,3-diacylglucosamine hydrolase
MIPLLYSKPMVSALYKRIFLPYQAILSFIVCVHIFVADIHLTPDVKKDAERFISWLSKALQDANAIYILGDLFDYWYSGMESRFQDVLEAMQSPKVHMMPGNRDFLLNNSNLKGIDIIQAEEKVVTLNGSRILLAHGHTLTEADTGFKLLHRYGWPVLRQLDRLLPLILKERCARSLVKSSAVIRPSSSQIRSCIEKEKGVDTVVCGHLHRHITKPGLIVLPAFYGSGQWLAWDNQGPRLCTSRYQNNND